jgi:hypothetical protein
MKRNTIKRIITVEGYIHPIIIVNELPHTSLRPYTDQELDTLPIIVCTGKWGCHPSLTVLYTITKNA